MVLWDLNAYLAIWKQKYTSQKFSKKYTDKNPYFCPTLELVKIMMFPNYQSQPSRVEKLRRFTSQNQLSDINKLKIIYSSWQFLLRMVCVLKFLPI